MKTLVTMSILAAAVQIAPVTFSQAKDESAKGWKQHQEAQFANLSPDEREKFKAANQKAMQDPAVQAARDKARQANQEFRDAMRAALLKADPSIQPILDKLPAMHQHD